MNTPRGFGSLTFFLWKQKYDSKINTSTIQKFVFGRILFLCSPKAVFIFSNTVILCNIITT